MNGMGKGQLKSVIGKLLFAAINPFFQQLFQQTCTICRNCSNLRRNRKLCDCDYRLLWLRQLHSMNSYCFRAAFSYARHFLIYTSVKQFEKRFTHTNRFLLLPWNLATSSSSTPCTTGTRMNHTDNRIHHNR